jgi:hypothetical protein
MNRRSLPLVIVLTAVLVLGLAVLNRAQSPTQSRGVGGGVFSMVHAEDNVTVTLRGDAAGLAFHERGTDGFLVTRKGKIRTIEDKWFVLESGERRSVIPLDAVLLFDVAK